MNDYENLLNRRFACKNYKDLPLKPEEENLILEYARLTPSSFGLEAWHVYAVSKRDRKALIENELFEACFGQNSVKTAAFVVALTYCKEENFLKGSELLKNRASRFTGGISLFEADFRDFYENLPNKNEWSKAQTYLMGMNMCIGASSIKIESCILEGYNENAVAKLLDIDLKNEGIGLVIPFGYPDEEMLPKLRISLDELVSRV